MKIAAEYAKKMTREEYLDLLGLDEGPGYMTRSDIVKIAEDAIKFADSHPLNPWKSVKEIPVNVWCYCRDKADERPYLAIIEDTGDVFNEDMDVCFPKYFMPIPELPKEDTK